ncbi:MAG: molybdopterin dinucleotide binding domain-containing protein [Gordonibacter pamelaeae]
MGPAELARAAPTIPTEPERAEEYPLTVTTGRRIPVYFHSEHRQLPWSRELWPVPRVEINPQTADEYGIEQGDWVWIETPWGKIREVRRSVLRRGPQDHQLRAHLVVPRALPGCRPRLPTLRRSTSSSTTQRPGPASAVPRTCAPTRPRSTRPRPRTRRSTTRFPATPTASRSSTTSDDPRLKEWLPTYEGRE